MLLRWRVYVYNCIENCMELWLSFRSLFFSYPYEKRLKKERHIWHLSLIDARISTTEFSNHFPFYSREEDIPSILPFLSKSHPQIAPDIFLKSPKARLLFPLRLYLLLVPNNNVSILTPFWLTSAKYHVFNIRSQGCYRRGNHSANLGDKKEDRL